jgi:CelD/BcsL family acetyltransferase involved in cellulose biosynthesis
MLQFLGADPAITEARSVVCEPELEHEAYRALLEDLDRDRDDWDFVRWSGIPANNPVVDGVESYATVSEGASAFVLDLPGSWGELRTRLPRNIKESLRKCYNSLRRDGLAFELRVARAADASEALRTFYRLHGLRASVDSGITHADVFASHNSRAFLSDYFAHTPAEDALVFELVIGGEVVATRLAFRSGAKLYLYYSGYSPAFSRYSVMTTLVAEILKWAITQGIACVHLSFGRDVSKTRWRPREVPFVELRRPSPCVRGRMVAWAYGHMDVLRRHRHFGSVTHAVLGQLGLRATKRPPPSP